MSRTRALPGTRKGPGRGNGEGDSPLHLPGWPPPPPHGLPESGHVSCVSSRTQRPATPQQTGPCGAEQTVPGVGTGQHQRVMAEPQRCPHRGQRTRWTAAPSRLQQHLPDSLKPRSHPSAGAARPPVFPSPQCRHQVGGRRAARSPGLAPRYPGTARSDPRAEPGVGAREHRE